MYKEKADLARLDDLNIADRDSEFSSGGAFLLKTPSRYNYSLAVSQDIEVSVADQCPYAVVRFSNTSDPDETLVRAFEAVHEGLNTIAARGRAFLEIHKAFQEYLIWWRQGSTQVLRSVCIDPLSIHFEAKVTALDAEGNELPTAPTESPFVQGSLHHFRRSQSTESLFESFNEMYLAFENLISWGVPKEGGESESKWLRRALRRIESEIDVPSLGIPVEKGLADWFYRQIYEGVRCRTFHSKEQRDVLNSGLIADREIVTEAVEQLGRILMTLYREWLDIRISSGGLTYAGFDIATQWLQAPSRVLLSDSDLVPTPDDTIEHPVYRSAIPIPSQLISNPSQRDLKMILGATSTSSISLSRYWRSGLVCNEALVLYHGLKTAITLDGIDRLEIGFGLRLVNQSAPKSYFLE